MVNWKNKIYFSFLIGNLKYTVINDSIMNLTDNQKA